MTAELALTTLRLQSQATTEEITTAYGKLIRRYPPEFHPDKFREIDDAYRFLTSFTHMLERLFSSESKAVTLQSDLFNFDNAPPAALLEEALSELKKKFKTTFLWGGDLGIR